VRSLLYGKHNKDKIALQKKQYYNTDNGIAATKRSTEKARNNREAERFFETLAIASAVSTMIEEQG